MRSQSVGWGLPHRFARVRITRARRERSCPRGRGPALRAADPRRIENRRVPHFAVRRDESGARGSRTRRRVPFDCSVQAAEVWHPAPGKTERAGCYAAPFLRSILCAMRGMTPFLRESPDRPFARHRARVPPAAQMSIPIRARRPHYHAGRRSAFVLADKRLPARIGRMSRNAMWRCGSGY